MKVIFHQRVTRQINDNEFDTCTESLVLSEEDSIRKLIDWTNRKVNAYCWGHIEVEIQD